MQKNSFQLQFIVLLMLFGLIIEGISFITNSFYEERELKNRVQKLLNQEISLKKETLNTYISELDKDINVLSSSKIFLDYIEYSQIKKTFNNKKLHNSKELFKNIFAQDSKYRQIRFIDKTGQEIINLRKYKENSDIIDTPLSNLQNKKNRYYFKEASKLQKHHIWLSSLDLNVENNKIEIPYVPTLRIAAPVYIKNQFEGIVILNTFANQLIEQLINSQFFTISLLDNSGNFIVGKLQSNNANIDLSWSKYLGKTYTLNDYLPEHSSSILKSKEFHFEDIYTVNLSQLLMIPEGLILLVEPMEDTLEELNKFRTDQLIATSFLVFLLSIPIALLLSKIPAGLNNTLLKATKQIEDSNVELQEYKNAMDESNIISKADLKGNITYVNDLFCEVSGFKKLEVLGQPHSIIRHPDTPPAVFKDMWKTIQSKRTWQGEIKNKKKNGDYYIVSVTIYPILNSNNEISEYIAIRHEITELIEKKAELEDALLKDGLTSLGNRNKLMHDIEKSEYPFLALLDVDRFGEINDFYGDEIGDKILVEMSSQIKSFIQENCNAYRLYADKFAILGKEISKEQFIKNIDELNKILSNAKFKIQNIDITIFTSGAISFEEKDSLLVSATMAHKFAKNTNHLVIYNEDMNREKEYQNNIDWKYKIKKAIEQDRIIPYYQPIYNNNTKKIEKYESLMRLISEDGTPISPYFFLEISKKSKQYLELTKQIVKKSIDYFADKEYEFSINITVDDITNEEIVEFILEELKRSNVANRVVFEMVESEGIENFEIANKFIQTIEELGCKVAIDDFGTGYSNFDYLIKLKANYIKIDGSMIKNIDTDKDSQEIVKTIITFAKSQGLKTIAEYVSSKEIFDKVNELGIDYSQGYYISEPRDKIKL